MSDNQESNNNQCQFCGNRFKRASTLDTHLCETKRRWTERDNVANRLAYVSWVHFFKTTNKKKLEIQDFIRSAYYGSFIKFGNYMHGVRALAVDKYVDWLMKNAVHLHDWTSDKVYTKYLIEHIRDEPLIEAIPRSVQHCENLADRYNIKTNDVFRYLPENVILHSVTTGKISPWMLYQSNSGHEFLNRLNSLQEKLITDYIDPEKWALKFKREPDNVTQARKVLKELGW